MQISEVAEQREREEKTENEEWKGRRMERWRRTRDRAAGDRREVRYWRVIGGAIVSDSASSQLQWLSLRNVLVAEAVKCASDGATVGSNLPQVVATSSGRLLWHWERPRC
ncbi:hypothetical protein KFK09_023076 [Dendrobium nobile]|uniref:Uncharacterized protein n=1 Tax=Dendrobium nobile TaxID=94219 RepID=A0A8T3ALR0_DENNO|nr:hypothetical protein KFK09_023076 [Dendrobium nobile]